jgi:primosomal protein N' (replication factor Y)
MRVSLGKYCVHLLRSGAEKDKMQIYLRLVDETLNMNKNVIFLVPEINLASYAVQLFLDRYGSDCVAEMHSGLSNLQRSEQLRRIIDNKVKIVVGTRMAVFAPLKNLGLIIMNGENDSSYKSLSAPRYSTKEIAVFRAKYNECTLILSSATPTLKSSFAAQKGEYCLHILERRCNNVAPRTKSEALKEPKADHTAAGQKIAVSHYPDHIVDNGELRRKKNMIASSIEVIDMHSELQNGNTTPISSMLLRSLKQNILNSLQSVLILNRRGYHTLIKCRECGNAVLCPGCGVPLNQRISDKLLFCHRCGYSEGLVKICPKCRSKRIFYTGFGTEKIEEMIKNIFPEARVLRLDSDANLSGKVLLNTFTDFADGKYDIAVGTQACTRMFRAPKVALIGIISVDEILGGNSFDSAEKAFALISNAVRMCDESNFPGKVLIQTFEPQSELIKWAVNRDYESFYKAETAIRKTLLQPPYCDICEIGFSANNEQKIMKYCTDFFKHLLAIISEEKSKSLPLRVFNPSADDYGKPVGKYKYKIIIKCKNNEHFRKMLSGVLTNFWRKNKISGVRMTIDFD